MKFSAEKSNGIILPLAFRMANDAIPYLTLTIETSISKASYNYFLIKSSAFYHVLFVHDKDMADNLFTVLSFLN